MAALRTLVVVVLVLAGRADASCPIALDGDPALTAQIGGELAAFSDDGAPCVAIRATCAASDGGLTIELSDELGGTAVRTFESPSGAAAFLMSWSRRPMPASGLGVGPPSVPVAPPRAFPVTSAADASPRWPSQPWHGELALSYVLASGEVPHWGLASVSLARQIAWLRFGFGVRLQFTDHDTYEYPYRSPEVVIGDAELMIGGSEQLTRRSSIRVEVTGGRSVLAIAGGSERTAWGQRGIRAGARATLAWRPVAALALELSGGYEGVRNERGDNGDTHLLGVGSVEGFGHLDVGLRWSL